LLREAAGVAARLELASLFTQRGSSLFADLLLQELLTGGDRAVAARALLALARMHERGRRFPDAVAYYRRLGRDFARDVVEGKKTGADLLAALSNDERFARHLDPGAEEQRTYSSYEVRRWRTPPAYAFSAANDLPPSLKTFRLTFDPAGERLLWTVRGEEEPSQSYRVTGTSFRHVIGSPSLGGRGRFLYQTLGHLAVTYLGDRVLAVDSVLGLLAWRRDLARMDKRTRSSK
jgi:hypothetical protein